MKYLMSFIPYSIVGLLVGIFVGYILSIPVWKVVILVLLVVAAMIFVNVLVIKFVYDARSKQVHAKKTD